MSATLWQGDVVPARDFGPRPSATPERHEGRGPDAFPYEAKPPLEPRGASQQAGAAQTDAGPGRAPRCDGPPPEPGPLDAPAGVRLALGDGPPPSLLGQVGLTYIAAEWGDDLLLIDQHAAHERLIYQQLLKQGKSPVPRQTLLAPIPLEVGPVELESLETLLPLLEEMGLEIAKDGSGACSVTALPADFDSIDAPALVRDMLDDLERLGPAATGLEVLRDRVLIRMACHAAIKGGQRLSPEEMRALIRGVTEARMTFTCPHGRPTMVLLRKGQLDRQFGRLA